MMSPADHTYQESFFPYTDIVEHPQVTITLLSESRRIISATGCVAYQGTKRQFVGQLTRGRLHGSTRFENSVSVLGFDSA